MKAGDQVYCDDQKLIIDEIDDYGKIRAGSMWYHPGVITSEACPITPAAPGRLKQSDYRGDAAQWRLTDGIGDQSPFA